MQPPWHSLALHSLRVVLATTFGCPNGQQHANLSSFLIISDTVAGSPRLHSRSSVSNAPWFAQMNLSISDSAIVPILFSSTTGQLLPRTAGFTAVGSAGIVSEVWKPKVNSSVRSRPQRWCSSTRGRPRVAGSASHAQGGPSWEKDFQLLQTHQIREFIIWKWWKINSQRCNKQREPVLKITLMPFTVQWLW